MSNENIFRYSYSAKQNEEVKAIRSKYLPQQESKPVELFADVEGTSSEKVETSPMDAEN